VCSEAKRYHINLYRVMMMMIHTYMHRRLLYHRATY